MLRTTNQIAYVQGQANLYIKITLKLCLIFCINDLFSIWKLNTDIKIACVITLKLVPLILYSIDAPSIQKMTASYAFPWAESIHYSCNFINVLNVVKLLVFLVSSGNPSMPESRLGRNLFFTHLLLHKE